MKLECDRFLTELNKLYDRNKEKGSVFITMKRSARSRGTLLTPTPAAACSPLLRPSLPPSLAHRPCAAPPLPRASLQPTRSRSRARRTTPTSTTSASCAPRTASASWPPPSPRASCRGSRTRTRPSSRWGRRGAGRPRGSGRGGVCGRRAGGWAGGDTTEGWLRAWLVAGSGARPGSVDAAALFSPARSPLHATVHPGRLPSLPLRPAGAHGRSEEARANKGGAQAIARRTLSIPFSPLFQSCRFSS